MLGDVTHTSLIDNKTRISTNSLDFSYFQIKLGIAKNVLAKFLFGNGS